MKEHSPNLINSFSEEAREEALQRFYLLRPALEEGISLTQVAQQHNLPIRTVQRWASHYQTLGLAGLVHQPRSDQGQRRNLPEKLHHLIEGLALQKPAPSTALIYRQVKEVADREGWKVPSYSQVYSVVRQIEPALLVLAQEGPKVYREEFDLLYRFEASQSNEIWQADHTLLDIWLLNNRGIATRPWLTIVIDDYSRAVAGYLLSFQAPSALQTSLAFRQAIWRKAEANWKVCGIPEIFYTDHGSDFTSHHLEQVCIDLKIQLIFSQVGIPRGRGKIERFFQTVNQLLLNKLPGYTLQDKAKEKAQLNLKTFEAHFRRFLLEEYLLQPHSQTEIAPVVRWEAGGFLPNLPVSLEQLDLLLLTVARTCQVQQDGFHFQGLRYMDVNLAAYVGEAVAIRYDPRDMAEIRVFDQKGFICRAVCQEIAGQTIGLKEIVQARNQRRQALQTDLKQRKTEVENLIEWEQPSQSKPTEAKAASASTTPRLKRYQNE